MLRYTKSGMMLLSIAYIIIGMMLLIMPQTSLLWICYAFGAVVLVTGIVCLIQYARIRGTGFTAPFMLVGGVITAGLGIFTLAKPQVVASFLPVVFGIFILVDGLSRVGTAIDLAKRKGQKWWMLLLLSVVSVALGVLLVLHPFDAAVSVVMVCGILLIVEGALNLGCVLYAAMELRTLDRMANAAASAAMSAIGDALDEAEAAETAETQAEASNKEATMTEDERVEAAIRAGEEAADNDFKLKFEQAQKELADVRSELDAAAEAQKAAEDKAKDATERTARLQADWENFRRRTASERIAERERATEKLVTALLPVVDDIERAIDHARSQELSDDFKQFVDGVDAVHAKLLDVFAHEGVEPIDPKGEAFDPLEHQAVGRVEDASQYDETVNDVYQKGYRMADRILRSAMVTVTYGGEKRPAPEPEAAPEDAAADTAESTEE